MTAEIALLNKTAVVLAADSAVTIGQGGDAKIFNTVNKIFEISNVSPVGLMIFNRLDFMDLPLEIIAKEYRNEKGGDPFSSVQDYAESFLNFLKKDVSYGVEEEKINHIILIWDALILVEQKFQIEVKENIRKTKKVLQSKFNGILQSVLKREIQKLDNFDFSEGYKRSALDSNLKELTTNAGNDLFRFFDLTQVTKDLMYRYVARFLNKKLLSSRKTGLIFAGFGRDEICPSLVHIEIDGIVRGKLKSINCNHVDIGRDGPAAEVLGFAQDDMVQSFVNGVDPFFRAYSNQILRRAIEESAKLVVEPILRNSKKIDDVENAISVIIDGLSGEFDGLAKEYSEKSDQFIERNFTQDVKSMVRSMPKQELANLAESLIDITSLKRKVTRERETVGGDVDVAVISRAEGFVWVKRKHYFPAELNARYFVRQSNQWSTR